MRIHLLLDFESLILNLKEKILFTKKVSQPVGVLPRLIVFLFHHCFRHRAAQACGQRDQSFAVFCKEVVIDSRLVIEAFQESRGHQLDQVVVTLQVFAQQHQVIASARSAFRVSPIATVRLSFFSAVVPAAPRYIHFAADDRLHVALACFVEKIGCRE